MRVVQRRLLCCSVQHLCLSLHTRIGRPQMSSEASQPVIFESKDIATDDDNTSVESASSQHPEDVDSGSIDTQSAFKKFAASQFSTRGKDFSDSVSTRSKRSKYEMVSRKGPTSSVAQEDGLIESPKQRFDRLKAEVTQFLAEIADVKSQQQGTDGEEPLDLADLAGELKQLQTQLSSAKEDVDNVISTDPAVLATLKPASQADVSKKIVAQLEAATAPRPAGSEKTESKDSKIVYELYYSQQHKDSNLAGKFTDLERRIGLLENALSANDTLILENGKGLVGEVVALKTRLDGLDEDSLRRMSQRLDVVTTKLEAAQRAAQAQNASATGAALSPQDAAKVDQVYASLLKSESLHGDLPVVIDRLLQLKTIHEEMAYIVSEFKTMDTEQAEIGGMLTSNEALLQKLESNFATNMEKVFENFKILEAKLSK